MIGESIVSVVSLFLSSAHYYILAINDSARAYFDKASQVTCSNETTNLALIDYKSHHT